MKERGEPALLVLESGAAFQGEAFGASGRALAEVVFNTSMTGYQEILTDPSYAGQIVTFTAPHIGNYGVNPFDMESAKVQAAGLVVRSRSPRASNFRATQGLDAWLKEQGVVGITGVDTRAVTRHIRDEGAMMGAIVHGAQRADVAAIVEEIGAAPRYEEQDMVARCSIREPMRARFEASQDPFCPWTVVLEPDAAEGTPATSGGRPRVAVLDFGVKFSILRQLHACGCDVWLLPHDTRAEQILKGRWDGLLVSNGPGDPARLDGAVESVRGVLGKLPIFGICLGHQIIGRALGGETFKLRFGHRGPNQPVLDAERGRVEITSQNHGFAVRFSSLPEGVHITHRNLNDQTVEGLRVPEARLFSLQHHPEAGPGPHDAAHAFQQFRTLLSSAL